MSLLQHPSTPAIAPPAPRFPSVRQIAVLRGGGIGDLLFALPAIQALSAAYPQAEMVLLGSPAHAELLRGRGGAPDSVKLLPVLPGVRPGEKENPAEVERFVERMRERRFDLAVQLHGGGRFSNPLLLRLGARHTVGMHTPDAVELERSLPYAYYQHEVLRALEVAGMAGAPPVTLEPVLHATDAERHTVAPLVDTDAGGLVVIHPGASDPRRRWPWERFAEVAERLADDGAQIIVVGDASERRLGQEIVQRVGGRPVSGTARVSSMVGQLTLSQLVGLFSHADVVLANDSGPRHLAQALGARTMGVYWFGNVINAAPLGRQRHRIQISWTTQCPACGRDCTQVGWTSERCEHEVSFVTDVTADAVYTDVVSLLEGSQTYPVGKRA